MSKKVATRSSVVPITEAQKSYGRTTARVQVATAVWELWDRLRKENGVDQHWLANRLDKDKGRVSRLLNGPGNWTLDTVADLLEAMGGRLTWVEAHSYEEIAQGKADRKHVEGGTRRIVHIKTEIVVMDEADTLESAEWALAPIASLDVSRPLALPITEKVEVT